MLLAGLRNKGKGGSMKSPFAIFKNRSLWDSIGFFALLCLLVINAFHFKVNGSLVYYREIFFVMFFILSAGYLLKKLNGVRASVFRINKLLFFLFLFPVLLVVWSFLDSGRELYGGASTEDMPIHVPGIAMSIYVLRNAVLYLPMVLYFYLRGLSLSEIKLVAFVAILIAPLSISSFLLSNELATLATLGVVAELGGRGLAYNTYVPYLTFLILCGIYLFFSTSNILLKLFCLTNISIATIYCLLTTSRQSLLFILICLAIFFFYMQGRNMHIKKSIYLAVMLLVGIVTFFYFTQDLGMSEKLIDRFTSVEGFTKTPRVELFVAGLAKLNSFEWFTGAGLTSVIFSGPHNDYIRWTQRVGLPLMILGFLPFLMTFIRSARAAVVYRGDNTLYLFLTLAIGYTLFHSFFGYPREDANQAVAVYVGLALWLGAYSSGLLPKKFSCRERQFKSPSILVKEAIMCRETTRQQTVT